MTIRIAILFSLAAMAPPATAAPAGSGICPPADAPGVIQTSSNESDQTSRKHSSTQDGQGTVADDPAPANADTRTEMAIKTKGTGAQRTELAIKTKGTGAQRTELAIKTKGTGAQRTELAIKTKGTGAQRTELAIKTKGTSAQREDKSSPAAEPASDCNPTIVK